jgi:hypothetical protein
MFDQALPDAKAEVSKLLRIAKRSYSPILRTVPVQAIASSGWFRSFTSSTPLAGLITRVRFHEPSSGPVKDLLIDAIEKASAFMYAAHSSQSPCVNIASECRLMDFWRCRQPPSTSRIFLHQAQMGVNSRKPRPFIPS